jgi:preprotein translocase subunit SecD
LQLVLGWPVRILVIALLLLSLVVNGAGKVSWLPSQIAGVQLYLHKGLDLSGGTDLIFQMEDMPPGQSPTDVQQRTIDIIEKRINALGVSEPVVTAQGNDRIEVQLAGVPASKAQSVIGQTARLVATTWVKDPSVTNGPYPGWKPQLTALQPEMLTSASAQLDQSGGSGWVVETNFNGQGGSILSSLTSKLNSAYNACQTSGDQSCPQGRLTYWLNLTPDDINHWNQRADKLYTLFDQGGKLITDPVVQGQFAGQAQIQGGSPPFTATEAKNLATLLNSGALPVTLRVISSTDVGASLGADSIKQSIAAGLLGLAIVVLFMVFYYRLPGLLASLALLFYAAMVFALFEIIPVTLTLAGLAGFILSVGMAVDANVLIFERFKEEVRSGRTVPAAVEAAVRRAWPAIRDSNTSTLITSAILAFAGSGEVKGFAVTLMLGVACSLVSSIIVTHNLLAIVLNFGTGMLRRPQILGVARGRA